MKGKALLLLLIVLLAMILLPALACGGTNSKCYSTYEGCDGTATVIETAIAAAATARADDD